MLPLGDRHFDVTPQNRNYSNALLVPPSFSILINICTSFCHCLRCEKLFTLKKLKSVLGKLHFFISSSFWYHKCAGHVVFIAIDRQMVANLPPTLKLTVAGLESAIRLYFNSIPNTPLHRPHKKCRLSSGTS